MKPNVLVSFVLSRRHHEQSIVESMARIERCGLPREQFEILVIDRAEPDANARMLAGRFPLIYMMAQAESPYVRTLAEALAACRGDYIVLLEDDSYPRPGAVLRMIMHFDADPRLGAAVFTATRPDGSRRTAPWPNIIQPCGTGLCRRILEQLDLRTGDAGCAGGAGGAGGAGAGGAQTEFDVSLRLLEQGWEIRPFDDLHVTHLDLDQLAPAPQRLAREVRQSLLLATQRFPQKWIVPFARDWMRRYRYQATKDNQHKAYYRAIATGLARCVRNARRRTLDPRTFESLVKIDETERRLREAQRQYGLTSILLLDYSPHLLSFWLAAKKLGLRVAAIADRELGQLRRRYRGVRILSDEAAGKLEFDAAIATSLRASEAAERIRQWRAGDSRPAIDLFDTALSGSITFSDRAPSAALRTAARSA